MGENWSTPKPAPARHELGTDLSRISIDELRERMDLLAAEIRRLEAEIERKQASRDAATTLFRL